MVAACVALVIFRIWYPPPFAAISGGFGLFGLIVGIDVILGPALTAVIASPAKPLGELRRDLAFIVLLQAAAFGYGVYSLALARPVWLAFEVDRMRVVTAADIDDSVLDEAPPELRSLSWTGPRLIAAIKPTDPAEQLRSVELGLAGFDLAMVPRNWRPYATQLDAVWRTARPASQLAAKYPHARQDFDAIAAIAEQRLEDLRFLPLLSRQASWVTLIAAPGARVVGHLPLDGFFR